MRLTNGEIVSRSTGRGLFIAALGVIWIALSLALPLSRAATAGLAAIALAAAVLASIVIGQGSSDPGQGRSGRRWRGLSYRNKVNVIAAAAAIVAFLGAGTYLLLQPVPEKSSGRVPGETTRTVTHSHEDGESKEGKSSKDTRAHVVESKEPVEKADESLLGRAVDNTDRK